MRLNIKDIYSWVELRFLRFQFLRFVVVGGSATVIDFSLLIFLTEVISLHYLLSATISFICANIFNFYFSKKWTFQNTSSRYIRQYMVFVLVGGTGLVINNYILYFSVENLYIHYILGKVIATALVMIWNFFMNKYVTFGKI